MDIRHLTVFVYRTRFFLRQSPSDVKQEKQMSSILDDQLRLMALKQYGLIKSIKTPDISEEDLRLILKNTENETIKQLATEKLQYLNSHPRLGWAGSLARANRLGRFHSESTKS